MIGLNQIIVANPEKIFAIDDDLTEITGQELMDFANQWAELHGSRKLVFFKSCNNILSFKIYVAMLLNNDAIAMVGKDISNVALDDLIALYQPDILVDSTSIELKVTKYDFPRRATINDDISILLSTSGSTGSPKLVLLSKTAVTENAKAIVEYLNLSDKERPFLHLPISYSFGLSILNSHLLSSATIILSEKSIMEADFWRKCEELSATSFSGVPFHFEVFLRMGLDKKVPPTMRTFTQAGGKLAPAFVKKMYEKSLEKSWDFYVMYGQTEAGPRISYVPPKMLSDSFDKIGIPIPGVEILLRTPDGEIIDQPNQEGELVIKGPSIMMGYAECFDDLCGNFTPLSEHSTGDVALRSEDGLYKITGRLKRFIKLQGNRVSLDNVEARLKQNGYDVACVGEDDKLIICCESDELKDEIKQSVMDNFSFPVRSIKIANIGVLPRAASGKLLYSEVNKTLAAPIA